MTAQCIAYVYPKRFFFVAKDIEGLSQSRRVLEHGFIHGPTWFLPFDVLSQLIFLFRAKRKGVRKVIAHFMGFHTVLPVLLGFDVYIVVAGSDACSFPGIGYGSFRKAGMRWAMTFSAQRARVILPVHSSLEQFDNTYSDLGRVKQGYRSFIPDLRTPTVAVPYGFDPGTWDRDDSTRPKNSLLCVAFGATLGNAVHFRKGLDLVMEAADRLPDHTFTLVGLKLPANRAHIPPNVRLVGTVPPFELKKIFASHSIYLQPSVMEGFPNALCEAMLCGCIPIVSQITSMPSIVGDVGLVLPQRNASDLVRAIENLSRLSETLTEKSRHLARARVVHLSISARIKALEHVLGIDHQDKRDSNSLRTLLG